MVLAPRIRDAGVMLEGWASEQVWCLTDRGDRKLRKEEGEEEFSDGEDAWSENDEIEDGPHVRPRQPADPGGA